MIKASNRSFNTAKCIFFLKWLLNNRTGSQNKLIKLVWSVSCRAHLKSIFSISRVTVFKKQIFFTISVFWESKNFFIKTNFFLRYHLFSKLFFSKFFSPLRRAWNCDHFFLLQIFSNSAQLAVRAFCPKWTALTSALVKVIDVAGLTIRTDI